MRKLKILYTIAIVALLTIVKAAASGIDSATAVLAANNWYGIETGGNFSVANVTKLSYNGHATRYIVNYTNNGFVMTAAIDGMNPILGYSTEHSFNINDPNTSPELEWMLSIYDKVADSLITHNVPSDSLCVIRWQNLLAINTPNTANERHIPSNGGFYLIETLWNQWAPYNNLVQSNNGACVSGSLYGNNCPTGCVATAMGQIMKYWNWPPKPYGENIVFDWCNMSVAPDLHPGNAAHDNAVATLLANIGKNVHMSYCSTGEFGGNTACSSGAIVNDGDGNAGQAFRGIYSYWNAKYTSRWTDNWYHVHVSPGKRWENFLDDEINNNQPVLYAGGSHCFILDGYNVNDEDLFHFNFGWTGTDDGFYYIYSIITSNGSFNDSQGAITGISAPVTDCNNLVVVGNTSASGGTLYNNGSVTIGSGSSVIYAAYKEVDLKTDFTAAMGCNFTAKLVSCPNCPPIPDARMAASHATKLNPAAKMLNRYYQLIGGENVKQKVNNQRTNYALQAIPNPFNQSVNFTYSLSASQPVSMELYDIAGRHVATVLRVVQQDAGAYTLSYDGSGLAAGVYTMQVKIGEQFSTQKLVKTE